MTGARSIAVLAMTAAALIAHAQLLPEFTMRDTVVDICKGRLLDSEAGPGGAIYGNNEDFTFTITTGGIITMTFSPVFCTEAGLDIITFFDGPSTASPQIGGSYSGTIAPPVIVANSGSLTVHFVSDLSVAYCGWDATWRTQVPPPVPPVMTVPVPPPCNSAAINVHFSKNVNCDSIDVDAFSLSGNNAPTVISATPVACGGDSTMNVFLQTDALFDRNCPYTLSFMIALPDRCDSLWHFTLTATFQVNTCPVNVSIDASTDTICDGSCATLTVVLASCNGATYNWNNGLPPTAGPHAVCPVINTTYTVNVVESGTGNTASASITIVVSSPHVTNNDTTLCQSAPPFNLQATPVGGWWSGLGITDSIAGTFDPDTSGPGLIHVHYVLASGCADSVLINVEPSDAGLDEAACPGSAPFFVTGFTPPGGTWSGPFIQSNGLFDPSTPGSYIVTYSQGNCTDFKTINVDTIVGPAVTDTVCQSVWPFDIPVTPFGGIWSGPGITDTIHGTFDPDISGGGTQVLTYALHGCLQQFIEQVKPIDAGYDHSACPSQSPFTIVPVATPPGGTWSGLGITDPIIGMYDPGLAGGGGQVDDVLIYTHPEGCTDTIHMYVVWTVIGVDTFFLCVDDPAIELDDYNVTGRIPWGGVWSGAGVQDLGNSEYALNPALAGIGVHSLVYAANTCSDTAVVIVYPTGISVPDMTLCSTAAPFLIQAMPPGAAFIGPGIADPLSGVFDPASAGSGTHTIYYVTPAWCIDSMLITVYDFQAASITGVLPQYCSNDTTVDIALAPSGGTFTGLPDSLFNPSVIAPGNYTLIYSFGTGQCFTSDTLTFVNYPPLVMTVMVSEDTVCDGGAVQIDVSVTGGDPNAPVQYMWSDGLFPVPSQSVSPAGSHTYYVLAFDGCGDPVSDSIPVAVFQPFNAIYTTSDTLCYGDPGFAHGSVIGGGNYTFTWNTTPPQIGDSIITTAGELFTVHVENNASGCGSDTLISVPAWPPIVALFSTNPNDPCIAFDQSNVTFIDLSNNAVGGEWTINDQTIPYVYGQNPEYDHATPGVYNAQLVVYNIGGCVDTFALSVCILDPTPVFVPDAFSPNGDGSNDVLFVRGPGIVALNFTVWDRWGEKVFETHDTGNGWDGTHNGARMPSGIYVYLMNAVMNDGKRVELKGDVTLVR